MPGKDGRLVAQYSKDGNSVMLLADVSDGNAPATDIKEYSGEKDGLPMMFGGTVAAENKDLYFIGGSPSTPSSIYKWNVESKDTATILACSSSLMFPDEVISVPKQVEFPTTLGTAFGYYYAPKNGKYKCTTEKAPPLLVKAHGGPTACTGTSFNAGIQVRKLMLAIIESVLYCFNSQVYSILLVLDLSGICCPGCRLRWFYWLWERLPSPTEEELGYC